MHKKVADRVIDGRLYFQTNMKLEQIILSVKVGKLKPTDVRDLRGVMEREKCPIAGFLCLNEPTKALPMDRSEEHTSELQSLMRISYAVFCLKKKNIKTAEHKKTSYKQANRTKNRHKKHKMSQTI